MVITFSNIKGSAGGGGGATGGTVSGITLWSDETTKAYIDDALSGVTDVLSAYTKTEDFATINGSAITSGGNIVVEATPYTAGTNIDITDHIISVTGITVPTKVSELVNDKGYITTADTQNFVTSGDVQTQINDSISGKADSSAVTAQISEVKAQIEAEIPSKVSDLQNDLNFASTGDVETQITGKNYATESWVQDNVNLAIESETARTESTYAKIGDIPSLDGYATTGWVESQGYLTGYTETDPLFMASPASGISEQDITNWNAKLDSSDLEPYYTSAETDNIISNAVSGKLDTSAITAYSTTEEVENMITAATNGLASEEWVNSQGFLKEHQDISGKLDTSVFITYTASTQTELNNKQDASAMTAYATTAFTESTYLKEHQSLSAYSTTEQVQTLINTAKQEVENEIPDVSDFVTSAQVETQITDKGYITGYTETDPVFMASPASGISAQDITNWNAKLDSSALTPYYTSAQTDNAISNAVSVKVDSSRVDEIEEVTASALVELHNTKQDILVSGTNIKTINNQSLLGSGNIEIQGGSGSDYSAGANIDITNNVISVTGITTPTKLSELTNDEGFVNSGEVETQITSKGYITAYTESDPVFQASAASGISEQDITNWNNKLDSSALNPYYTSAQTDTAISNATSGKQDTLVSGTNIKTINNQSLLGSGNIEIQGGSGGSNIIELTQAEYDALTAYTEDAIYVITDAQAINMDNYATTGVLDSYYTSAQTDTAISNAVSGKTDKVSVTASSSGYKFPTWNDQGCITGTSATAFQASQNINGSRRKLYSDFLGSLPTIYAPTSAGSAGQPLLSNGGGAPVWGSYKFQFMSKSEYDALTTKDSTTIYFIVNEN